VTETSSSRAAGRGDAEVGDDPFGLLGLAPRPGLSDDDVRGAWRRIAAATHPDREDGGDPARFGAAAGAYVVLRTEFGRGEALADLGLSAMTDHRGRHAHRRGSSADPDAHGAGRHRARREAPVDRRREERVPGLSRLGSWTTRPAAARNRAGGARQDSASATGQRSGRGSNWRPWGPRLRRRRLLRRPGGLALRVSGVAAMPVVAVVISGWSPGVVGVLAGMLTWLVAAAGRAACRRRSQRPLWARSLGARPRDRPPAL
jgi:curved DNA-binding protein CbpA